MGIIEFKNSQVIIIQLGAQWSFVFAKLAALPSEGL